MALRFLRRLCADERIEPADCRVDAAVIAHLNVLLNARAGSGLLTTDYGLPDTTRLLHDVPASLPGIQHALVACIRRHEPRLSDVIARGSGRVEPALRLSFLLDGRLGDGRRLPFTVTLTRGARVRVARTANALAEGEAACS